MATAFRLLALALLALAVFPLTGCCDSEDAAANAKPTGPAPRMSAPGGTPEADSKKAMRLK